MKSEKLDEKWRPKELEDFVGNPEIIKGIGKMIKERNIPHLMFSGMQGTGKTSLGLLTCRKLFGKVKHRYIEINASDENGIEIVRTKVKEYAKNSGGMGGVDFRVIILDEADEMTTKAQAALRRIMEKYYQHCRFILICNNKWKIIPPIQSRCDNYDFLPVSPEEMMPRLEEICEAEEISITPEALNFIAKESNGDMRMSLNTYLEKCRRMTGTVSINNVRKMDVDREVAEKFIKDALNGKVTRSRDMLLNSVRKGSNLRQLFRVIANITAGNDKYPEMMKGDIFLALIHADESIVGAIPPDLTAGGLAASIAISGEKHKKGGHG